LSELLNYLTGSKHQTVFTASFASVQTIRCVTPLDLLTHLTTPSRTCEHVEP